VRRPRCSVVLLVALSSGLASAGCGGSSGSPAASSSTASAALSPTPAPSPLSAAAAHALAVAAALQTADLPGYKEDKTARGNAKAPDASDKATQACISGSPDGHYLADVTSSDFTKGTSPLSQLNVSSETQVVATAEQGTKEFANLQKPDTLACLNTALSKTFSAQAGGAKFSGTLKRTSAATPTGADGVAAFVIDGVFAQQGVTIKLRAGLELLLVGRAEVALNDVTIGNQLLADTERDRLAAVLATRARAAQR
jgi:hypothetical protein